MSNIIYRQMQAGDVEEALALRNEVFSDSVLAVADWERTNARASIALLDGQVVGAIPLFERQLVIARDMMVRTAFENSVGTRAELRSRGIGAGMITAARQFLHEQVDGLFVYRNDERSKGYRFYARTGHSDLAYTRRYRLSHPKRVQSLSGEPLAGAEAICTMAGQLLPLFLSTYGQFGGFPQRHEGYWQQAFSSIIFSEISTDFYLIQERSDGGELAGYAIVGIPRHDSDARVQIMEMATRGGELNLAAHVLARVCSFAAERSLPVEMIITDEDPFVSLLLATGFDINARDTIVMGQLIDPQSFFQRCWQHKVELYGCGLQVSTEVQDYTLISADTGFPTVTLEMKEETFHRWLLGRINLTARLREGTITVYGTQSETVLEALCQAIPFTSWAYHHLDWI